MFGNRSPRRYGYNTLALLLLKKVLRSLAVVAKQRKQIPGHVELELGRPALIEMIIQHHLREGEATEGQKEKEITRMLLFASYMFVA